MKKIISKTNTVLTGLLLLTATMLSAQSSGTQKTDKVIFLNGTTKEGKVISFANEKVQFVHLGETLNYEFSKNEIEKIEYASGRTEMILEKKTGEVAIMQVNSKNRVAVMPMIYIGDGNEDRADAMSFQLQQIAISCLSNSATELRFLDPANINAVLLRNGINDFNIRKHTPAELAAILNVEYIIMGSVLQDKGRVVTVVRNNNNGWHNIERHPRDNRRDERNRRNYRDHHRNNRNSSVVTKQNIETHVSLTIYNERGESIYNRSRQSLLSAPDAYKNTIQYLLKRTPLYNR